MEKPFYKSHFDMSSVGIRMEYSTTPGGYHPLHWHEEIEILYSLNGDIRLTIDGKKYYIREKQFAVIESCKVHSTYNSNKASMFLCIHITKKALESFFPNIELYRIVCLPELISDEQLPAYQQICDRMEYLTRLYIQDAPTFTLESNGLIMQIAGQLLRDFSTIQTIQLSDMDQMTRERIRKIITYVDEHYTEPISLQEICDHVGLGKEYFCRFFKKNMHISFLNYLNEVRLAHIYQNLQTTNLSISEIMLQNGLTNQKLFNRSFKALYGCTPSEVRKAYFMKNNSQKPE